MKCVAEAIVANGVQGLVEMVPGGPYAYKIGADAIKKYRERRALKKLEDDVKEMIAAKADAVLAVAKQAVEEAAPQLPPREKELVLQFITAIPETARQSMKRQEDPTGSSLPFGFTIHEPADVVNLLPRHAPQFVPGEWVPGREDNWQLERRLGGGGFGEVWLARHHFKKTEKPRAVKFCTNANARAKLITHEKQLIVQVMNRAGEHPNIVPLLECHLSGETPWLMYEYVAGGTLTDAILEWQKKPPAERLNCVIEVLHTIAGAVAHCHELNPAIVHRDLKPANILMDRDVPRVTDFGIGGTTVDYLIAEEKTRGYESVMGRLPSLLSGAYSPMYSSPQQRNHERPDPRDDVHALGVIAFQMLVGRVDAEVKGNWQRRLKGDGVPESLIELIGNSTSDEPSDRPKDASEWATLLAALIPEEPSSVDTPREDESEEDGPETESEDESCSPENWSFDEWLDSLDSAVGLSTTDPPEVEPADSKADDAETGTRAESTATPPKPVSRGETWKITVPGKLYARRAGRYTDWQKTVIETPAEVEVKRGKAYRLDVYRYASDVDLEGLAHLKGFTALRQLKLTECEKLTDAGIAHLAGLTALQQLDLMCCEEVTDVGIAHLAGLTALRDLKLNSCVNVTDAGLCHLSGLTALEVLDLFSCDVTDAGLVQLKGLIALRKIVLARTNITDAGLFHLKDMAVVQVLNLSGTQVTDAGLMHLRGLPALTDLYLAGTAISDAGLEHLKGMAALNYIDLQSTNVTNKGLLHLSGLASLQHLLLRSCDVTDGGLSHLKGLAGMKYLDLSNTAMTDAGLADLKGMTALRQLELKGCEHVTEAGIAALEKALPHCGISR